MLYCCMNFNKFTNISFAFTTRENGCSIKPYESSNLAFHVGDNLWHVDINHNTLASVLNYNKNTLVHMKQIHSNKVHEVTDEDNFENPPTCDALITNRVNTPLMIMVADCTPILFYDDLKKVIAVAHAGRAGAFSNIVKNVINSFIDLYDSNVSDIVVLMGASIGVCCYEVGEEIYNEACGIGLEYAFKIKDEKYYLDVNKILYSQLMACGIRKENIEISDECTACNTNKYFSYRAEGITGRFAGIIMLRESLN